MSDVLELKTVPALSIWIKMPMGGRREWKEEGNVIIFLESYES